MGCWSTLCYLLDPLMNNHNVCVPSGAAHGWHAEDNHRDYQCHLSLAVHPSCLCQWTSEQELWRGHGGDMEGTFTHPHIIPHITYVLTEQLLHTWSALGGLVLRMVLPHLSHSALCSGQSKRCIVAYNTHWIKMHPHTHIPGSQNCNNKQTCIGCTSSVTYTQSWALHAIHNVITHSERLKQCSQIVPLVSSTLQCAIGSALNIVAPADRDTLVNTPRPIPSTVQRSSSDGGSPTTRGVLVDPCVRCDISVSEGGCVKCVRPFWWGVVIWTSFRPIVDLRFVTFCKAILASNMLKQATNHRSRSRSCTGNDYVHFYSGTIPNIAEADMADWIVLKIPAKRTEAICCS